MGSMQTNGAAYIKKIKGTAHKMVMLMVRVNEP